MPKQVSKILIDYYQKNPRALTQLWQHLGQQIASDPMLFAISADIMAYVYPHERQGWHFFHLITEQQDHTITLSDALHFFTKMHPHTMLTHYHAHYLRWQNTVDGRKSPDSHLETDVILKESRIKEAHQQWMSEMDQHKAIIARTMAETDTPTLYRCILQWQAHTPQALTEVWQQRIKKQQRQALKQVKCYSDIHPRILSLMQTKVTIHTPLQTCFMICGVCHLALHMEQRYKVDESAMIIAFDACTDCIQPLFKVQLDHLFLQYVARKKRHPVGRIKRMHRKTPYLDIQRKIALLLTQDPMRKKMARAVNNPKQKYEQRKKGQ